MSTTVGPGETLHLCLLLAGVADQAATDVEWYTSLLRFLFLDLLIRFLLVLLVLVRKAGNPQTALTWVILLLGLPVVGLVLYLLFGEARFGYFRRKRHAEAIQRVDRPGVRADTNPGVRVELPLLESQIASLAQKVSGAAPVTGNRIELFGDSAEFVDRLIGDIQGATRSVHLLFYIYLDDEAGTRVARALGEAQARGVNCRLLVDAVGSKAFLKSRVVEELRRSGVAVRSCLPVNPVRMLFSRLDLRNHRKIAVIDGQVGFTGSNNLAEAAFAVKARFAPWVDCTVRIDGPATKELQVLFLEDWHFESGELAEEELKAQPEIREDGLPVQIIATGPNFYNEATTQIVQSCIQVVQHELILTTPYFVPDESTIRNLCVAAQRGVQTRLVVPKRNDSRMVGLASRSNYEKLLESGVEIFEFTKGLLHAKTITIDRRVGVVMSANLDRRSFELNFECGAIVYQSEFAETLRRLQQSYIRDSDRVDPEAWSRRGAGHQVGETLAGFIGPLL